MSEMPKHKREWPDGQERVADGSIVMFGASHGCHGTICVNELPREVRALMDAAMSENSGMITLHHHGDPETEVYVRSTNINAIDIRWSKLPEDYDG